MHDVFFAAFEAKVALTSDERARIQRYLSPKKLRRKQYLLQEGDPCKIIAFVEHGLLRSYSVDDAGTEHIIQFAPEGWTISDLYSFLTGEASAYNIDAVEDAELTLVGREAHEDMLRTIPKYETYVRLNITGAYLAMQRRLTATHTATNEERYEAFLHDYPDIALRVPQHMIASYLGLTPETLSRVRRRIASGQ